MFCPQCGTQMADNATSVEVRHADARGRDASGRGGIAGSGATSFGRKRRHSRLVGNRRAAGTAARPALEIRWRDGK